MEMEKCYRFFKRTGLCHQRTLGFAKHDRFVQKVHVPPAALDADVSRTRATEPRGGCLVCTTDLLVRLLFCLT